MRLPRYRFGEFELDPASRELSRNGERVALPPKSFECLTYLLANRERAVGRDELIAAVWGRVEVNDTVVAQTLLRARKVLDDSGERQGMIRTVPRFGYRWVAPVEEIQQSDATDSAEADEAAPDSGADGTQVAVAVPVSTLEVARQAPAAATDATIGSPRRDAPPRTRLSRWWWLLPVMVLVLAVGGWWWWASHRAEAPMAGSATEDLVVVLPVTVTPANGENAWVRLGAMDYIASRLRRAGLKVLPSDQTLHLSTRFGDTANFSDDDWQQLQQDTGARWILTPQAEHMRGGWTLRLETRSNDGIHAIKAEAATPLMAAAQATDSWLRRLDRATPAGERLPSPLTERVQQVDAELLAGQVNAARELIERAPAAQRRDPRLRVREGQLEYRAGHLGQAEDIFQRLLSMQPDIAPDIRARALMGQGAIAIRNRDFASAEAGYTAALQILEQDSGQEAPAMLGNAYNGRGVARVNQGKMAEAVSDMGRARIAMQRSGDFVEAAMVGSNLGSIEVMRGHYPQALQEFDRAIAVFDRFDVHDYLAATLTAKAESQLNLVQPEEALATIDRTDALIGSLEDPYLANRIRVVKTRVQLANGRLEDAANGIARLQGSDGNLDPSVLQELRLRLLSARGDGNAAAALMRQLPAADTSLTAGLALAAIQIALREGDAGNARAWQQRWLAGSDHGDPESATESAIIAAMLAQAGGDNASALRQARAAAATADSIASPELRVQLGLLQVDLLMRSGNADGAAAILGDLDSFASRDYRVAWAMLALYRSIDDPGMIDSAQRRLQSLRGERDINVQPLL
ncbi:winged helix-turn-helix domain-containing protein [Pseudoxanthomonas dokdonensis]|uniref:OmpR/PhoB-type domain-containing protein n=1 Tax=Pseudoxanthomonas dokdonensis TaxID=344882 RepID=A0A0R0D1S6_9GAMM|nr:winged helix-turn-helix domain-containing protein [Pseudoxanthomonas dokdonensis]KRG72017.1 hypothetical protein ABB29_00695 [Pseudoxanthomonas dokdonensis]